MLKVGTLGLGALAIPGVAQIASRVGFTHGVASGEPRQRSVMLWSRHVPISGDSSRLGWEIAETENPRRIVAEGTILATAERDWCVKVVAQGLKPGRSYDYRFLNLQGAAEVRRLADATRAGKASREELSGSTITISSLGPMGGLVSTPVINRPEVAIVAVNKVREMPVVIDGDLEIRKIMNLSLSCDHRVVDGWDAANFMQALKSLIENPLKLLSMR